MKEEIWRILFLVLLVGTGNIMYEQKNPELARTPPMGWNSWNWFGKKDIITNMEMIGINQDPSGQGFLMKDNTDSQIWIKKLLNGKVAVLLLNLDTKNRQDVTLSLDEAGLSRKQRARDVMYHKDLGAFKKNITRSLEPHPLVSLFFTGKFCQFPQLLR